MKPPRFEQNNVSQCWVCRNRDGSWQTRVNGYPFSLPYCTVSDAAMVRVYDNPCHCFEPKEVE